MGNRLRLKRGIAAAAVCVSPAMVFGQAAPATPAPPAPAPANAPASPPPGAVPSEQQLRPSLIKRSDAPVPEAPAAASRELGKPSDEITLDVSAYRVDDDAPPELRAALPKLTEPFVGKGKTFEDLVNATAAVTRYLQRELGFYLGYAFLPEQDPSTGVVRIAVLEGRLDEVILNWPDKMPVDRAVVEGYLARLKSGDVLRVRDVERVVFLVNDLRGINARFEVKAGRKPGTASLVVTAQPEARVASRVDLDNLGSRYSGQVRVSGLATISSPLGRGDGLVLNALTTQNNGLRFLLAGYTLPVGSDGLKVGASTSFVRYKLQNLENLDLHGDATTVTAYALSPAIRSRNLNLFTLASLDLKRYNDSNGIGSGDITHPKTIQSLQLSVSGDLRDDLLSGGVNTYELSLVHGRLKLESETLHNTSGNPPNFTLARVNATRLQNLIDNRLLMYGAVRGQFAFANLDTAEQFQLGGPDRVRAFAPGEGNGDQGLSVTAELRLLPPESLFGRLSRELVFSAFVDAGHVVARHKPTTATGNNDHPSTNLSGWGFGAIWDRPRDFAIRASVSWPISGTPVNDPVEKKPRLYISGNKSF